MWSTFKVTVKGAVRTPSIVIWTLVFPLVMTTIFSVMFKPLRTQETSRSVAVAVVSDDAWSGSNFAQVVDTLSTQDTPLLDLHEVDSEAEARDLIKSGEVDGAYLVDEAGDPRVLLAPADSPAHAGEDISYEVNRTIIESVASSFLQNKELLMSIAAENPALLADPAAVSHALSQGVGVQKISLTRSQPDQTVRYFYAFLGMASLFAAQVAEGMVYRLQPTASALGARQSIAGTSRLRLLIPVVAACWTVSTAFLGVGFGYMCVAGDVDFSGRIGVCLVSIAVCSLFSSCLGACIGALPVKGGADARSGLLTVATCLLALFAGVYGTPAMILSDTITQAFPAASWINPVSLMRDVFYSIYYYDSLSPFFLRLSVCIGLAAVFFTIAVALFRRQSYDHL
ncbi:ABC transporter permease [Collinsella vaginalis]|uniref:ABC transporter permease n=1 Tax=Collinsella vaginalis TaxID=1870987 RepID=UPI000A271EFB|nr:ABC transporter permease [Collinsella vaginalis]